VKRLENVKLERNETPDQRAKRLAHDRKSKIKSRATETVRTIAWAITVHKNQGLTLRFWERKYAAGLSISSSRSQ